MNDDAQRRCGSIVAAWKRPLLLTHTNADGDALGCLVAMRSVLRGLGADPLAVVFDPVPPRYALLVEDEPLALWHAAPCAQPSPATRHRTPGTPGATDQPHIVPHGDSADHGPCTVTPDQLEGVDGVLVMDTCAYNQLEPVRDWLEARRAAATPPIIAVDHHVTRDELADHYLIDPAAGAACVILYEWACACGWRVDAAIALPLFVGLATDTGWFRHANTDARTLETATALVRRGVKPHDVHRHLYQSEPAARLRLFAAALEAMELHLDDRVALLPIPSALLARTGATHADTEDLVNEPLRIATVEVSVLLAERSDAQPPDGASSAARSEHNAARPSVSRESGAVKLSFRSKGDLDVAALAARFGGGGHVKAAGARVGGTIEQRKKEILAHLRALLQ